MADSEKKTKRKTKGRMARELVYYCIYALTLTLAWAVVVKTVAVVLDRSADLSDVLIFGGGVRRGAAAFAVQASICKK